MTGHAKTSSQHRSRAAPLHWVLRALVAVAPGAVGVADGQWCRAVEPRQVHRGHGPGHRRAVAQPAVRFQRPDLDRPFDVRRHLGVLPRLLDPVLGQHRVRLAGRSLCAVLPGRDGDRPAGAAFEGPVPRLGHVGDRLRVADGRRAVHRAQGHCRHRRIGADQVPRQPADVDRPEDHPRGPGAVPVLGRAGVDGDLLRRRAQPAQEPSRPVAGCRARQRDRRGRDGRQPGSHQDPRLRASRQRWPGCRAG